MDPYNLDAGPDPAPGTKIMQIHDHKLLNLASASDTDPGYKNNKDPHQCLCRAMTSVKL